MVLILIAACIVSFLLGEQKDAIAILTIVLLNSLLGFRQEYRAEKAMAALKKIAVPRVRVRRDSRIIGISSNPSLLGAVSLTVGLQMMVVYLPFFQGIFRTLALSPADLVLNFTLSSVVFWAIKLEKLLKLRCLADTIS